MLNNIRNLQSLFWSHGMRWLLFRVSYALRRRTGYIRAQMPKYQWKDRPLETWLKSNIPSTPSAYTDWRRQNTPGFFFGPSSLPRDLPGNPKAAVDEADGILSGELKFFFHDCYQVGFPPAWHTDPVSGLTLDAQKHWSEISDDPGVDIKFIWESSRFAMVYPLVRAYASTRDGKYAEAFWELVQSWAESNPPNTGPNWMDGQEAALRLIAWDFGMHAFAESTSTTPERLSQLTVMIAAHAERIYKNIDYAISTHSNHTISEALGLWLVGTLYPEIRDSEKYLNLGRTLLEQEAVAQIFPDGCYSMYSLNYHRFILHLYLYAMRLAELNNAPFSEMLHSRIAKSVQYLSQLIDPETGQMPVYGSNDGALLLPLNDCDFTDYRPLLQLGSYVTKRQLLFEPGPWDDDLLWLYGETFSKGRSDQGVGITGFPDGGMYLLHGSNSKAIIRCTNPRSRPSHADQLHVDVWMHGQNIACDAGTYLYSGKGPWRNGLAHTAVHNTVTVDQLDQMKMLTRFTWTDWSHGKVLRHDEKIWQGEHDGYKRLADPVNHRRTVISLPEDRWLVIDHLMASQSHHYDLHWLLADRDYGVQELPGTARQDRGAPGFGLLLKASGSKLPGSIVLVRMGALEGEAAFSTVRADPNSTRGWRSRYYGEKEPAISVLLETDQADACFWSYFGHEIDKLNITAGVLEITTREWNTKIDLRELNQ